MSALDEKKRKRLLFLHHLYEVTDGDVNSSPMVEELGQELSLSRDEAFAITDYLEGEGLVETIGIGHRVGITHKGVREVEAALSEPDKPTRYFPPASHIIIVQGDLHNSPIQQGTHHSTQTISYTAETSHDLRQFLVLVKQELLQLPLAPDDQSQAEAEVTTMQAQLAAPRPNPGILKASGQALHSILLGVAGNLATDLLKYLGGFN
jgi:hypothetical protein